MPTSSQIVKAGLAALAVSATMLVGLDGDASVWQWIGFAVAVSATALAQPLGQQKKPNRAL